MTGRLDEAALRQAFEGLAATSPASPRTDLAAAGDAWAQAHQEGAGRRGRDSLRARPWVVVPALLAAAVLLALFALAALPSVRLGDPRPAAPPSGPGLLPSTVYRPGAGTPSILDRPISRAAYVVANVRGGPGESWVAAVVGADAGEYRMLPVEQTAGNLTLSADGRTVLWSDGDEVSILDLRTGRLQRLTPPGLWSHGMDLRTVLLSRDGRSLLLAGSDRLGPVEGRTSAWVWVLPTDALTWACVCAGPFAWTADGRVAMEPNADAPLPAMRVDGVKGTFAAPALTVPAEAGSAGIAAVPGLPLSPDGLTRYAISSAVPNESGNPDRFTLTSGTGVGPVQRTPLGVLTQADVVATGARGVVVRTWGPSPGGGPPAEGYTPLPLRLVAPDGTLTTLATSATTDVYVAAIATDVLDAGLDVPGLAPQRSDSGPLAGTGWWTRTAASVLRAAAPFLALAVPVLLIAVPVLNRSIAGLLRWLVRPVGNGLRRCFGTRARRRRTLVGATVLIGLGCLAAPAAAEQRWAQDFTSPWPGAPPLRLSTISDQAFVPPSAALFPLMHDVSEVWRGTLAGRRGLYAVDALTARVVRLDDLPGMPDLGAVLADRRPPQLALDSTGTKVAIGLGTGQVAVVWVDQRTAQLVAEPAGAGRRTPLAFDADGTLIVDAGGVQAARSAALAAGVRLAGSSPAELRVTPYDAVPFNGPYPAPGYMVVDRPWVSWLGAGLLAVGLLGAGLLGRARLAGWVRRRRTQRGGPGSAPPVSRTK